jgi:hypothetical protein
MSTQLSFWDEEAQVTDHKSQRTKISNRNRVDPAPQPNDELVQLQEQIRLLQLRCEKAEAAVNANTLRISNEELKEQNRLLWFRIRDDRSSEILLEAIYRQMIEENAVGIWFALCNGTITLQRDSTTYEIVAGDMKTQTFLARLGAEYEDICLSEKECAELHEMACQQVIAHYTAVVQSKKTRAESSTDHFEVDETEGVQPVQKREKVSVRELKERIAVLEVRAMLPLPGRLKELLENDRYASDRIHSLEYYLRESELYLKRQHRRIEELEGHPVEWCAFPPPSVSCRHCGKREWEWKGYGYQCRSCWVLSTEIENTCVTLREENQRLRERLAELEGKGTQS